MNNHPTAIIIFGRYPHPGKVKTRLAASIGDKEAAEFYRLCAEHTFLQVMSIQLSTSVYFYYSDADDTTLVEDWVAPFGFGTIAQSGNTLGERMRNAFDSAFRTGHKEVIIIGTDAPDISSEILRSSFTSLETSDVTIGPALDGGYYLLGLKHLSEDLFADIPWSTGDVFHTTTEKAQSHHLAIQLLPTLSDIDTLEDLQAWSNTPNAENCHELYHFAKKL